MKRIFRWFICSLAFISFCLGLLHVLRVQTARGMAMRTLKSLSEALSPFLAAIAASSAVLAGMLRIPAALITGIVAAALHGRYFRLVTHEHRAFEDSFGSRGQNWPGARFNPAPLRQMLAKRWQWPFPNHLPAPRWERDIVYHTIPGIDGSLDRELGCDLWQPPPGIATSGLALIYIHGGGYFTSSKDFGTRVFFRHLAEQGHVIMDIDYRLAPEADLFEMLDDVHHAVVWMKAHAELFGASPERIVLMGGSAGAHLALLAAYTPDHPRLTSLDLRETDLSVRAVVSYYGIVDLTATYRSIHEFMTGAPHARTLPENILDQPLSGKLIELAAWVRAVQPAAMREYLHENQNLMYAGLDSSVDKLLGGSPDEIPELYELVSPLTHAGTGCPAILLFQGLHDYLLPIEPTQALYRKLRAAGVQAVCVEFPQTEHTFDLFLPSLSPPAQSALYDLDRFLRLVE